MAGPFDYPMGGGGLFGMSQAQLLGADPAEEERKRREAEQQDALAKLASVRAPGQAATPSPLGGSGLFGMAQTQMLGRAPTMQDFNAPTTSPMSNPLSQMPQALNDMRGELPSPMGLSAMGGGMMGAGTGGGMPPPSVPGATLPQDQWRTGWGTPVQTPGVPPNPVGLPQGFQSGGMAGPMGGGPGGGAAAIQQLFQQAVDRHSNSLSGGAMFPQPEILDRAMKMAQMEVSPHLDAMQNQAKLEQARLQHHLDTAPETFAQKAAMAAYGTALGQEGGTPEKANAAMMLAYRDSLKMAKELNPSAQPMTPGGPASPLGTDWKATEDKAGGKGPETAVRDLKMSILNQLPPTVGVTRPGKGLPPAMGTYQGKLDQEWGSGILTHSAELARTNPKAAETFLSDVADANPDAKKALIVAAVRDKVAASDFNLLNFHKDLRQGQDINPLRALRPGDFPDKLTEDAGIPGLKGFSLVQDPGKTTRLARGRSYLTSGGFPFAGVRTPGGEVIPADLGSAFPSDAAYGNPVDPRLAVGTESMARERERIQKEAKARSDAADMILRAYGK